MKTWIIPAIFLLVMTGCGPVVTPAGPTGTAASSPSPPPLAQNEPAATAPSASPRPVVTGTETAPAVTATATTLPELPVCSPLEGLEQAGLEAAITNPYNPPPFGSDDPHQGIDLANFLPGTRIGVTGGPVQAVLAGVVALVIGDRFPYGSAVMLETPVDVLIAAGWDIPPTAESTPITTTLTCPGETEIRMDPQRRSLYLLYAHLEAPPTVSVGEPAACGSRLGRIGDSGNALNPHLHLEVRLGPSGAVFPGMSHYDPAASAAEMDSYCIWRVSGAFRPVDPVIILKLTEW
jgi:murein DD-endopeptidase MepM/ murein hydrolase activator NlpD